MACCAKLIFTNLKKIAKNFFYVIYTCMTNSIPPFFCAKNNKSNITNQAHLAEECFRQADISARKGEFDVAIEQYKKTISLNPEFEKAQYELAKIYKQKKDYDEAIEEFYKYFEKNNNATEALIHIADCYIKKGFFQKAIIILEEITKKEPDNDFVQRLLNEAHYELEHVYNPEEAEKKLYDLKLNKLKESIQEAVSFYPKGYTNSIRDVAVSFDKTQSLKGYANLAQYEHNKRKITISKDYVWADKNLIASYLVHEFVHAKDNDAYSSIREEQDAFRKQAQYWQKNNKGIVDPEMNYVLELYNKSPQSLDERVEMIYTSRDDYFPKTSPNHPPNTSPLKKLFQKNESKIIKYDTIA